MFTLSQRPPSQKSGQRSGLLGSSALLLFCFLSLTGCARSHTVRAEITTDCATGEEVVEVYSIEVPECGGDCAGSLSSTTVSEDGESAIRGVTYRWWPEDDEETDWYIVTFNSDDDVYGCSVLVDELDETHFCELPSGELCSLKIVELE